MTAPAKGGSAVVVRTVPVVLERTGAHVASRMAIADTWWSRLRGLLSRPPLAPGDALLLVDCRSIHTAGMRHPIDVAFLDAEGCVVRRRCRLAPWSLGLGGPRAVHALELPAGRLDETATFPGDRLIWS